MTEFKIDECQEQDSTYSNEGNYSHETIERLSRPGLIKIKELKELWFHTGTACNLSCDGCLEGSSPGDKRVEFIRFDEAKRFIDEAVTLGVKQFSFTGGEPFVNPDIIETLGYALAHRPCLVLTNGTTPLQKQFSKILPLKESPHPLSFRVSLDHYKEEIHDIIRGKGKFQSALAGIKMLEGAGFSCSIARRGEDDEDAKAIEEAYRAVLAEAGISGEKRFVSFPDLLPPNSHPEGLPTISEKCLLVFDGATGFMCETSRMVVKKQGYLGIYACTLVDDDDSYNLGATVAQSIERRAHLTHHRCFTCYRYGASCSEL